MLIPFGPDHLTEILLPQVLHERINHPAGLIGVLTSDSIQFRLSFPLRLRFPRCFLRIGPRLLGPFSLFYAFGSILRNGDNAKEYGRNYGRPRFVARRTDRRDYA